MKEIDNRNKLSKMPHLLPIVIFCAVVPAIIFTRFVTLSNFIAERWMGQPISADLFAYYKMIVIIGCGLVSLVLLIVKAAKKEIKIPLSIPVIIAAVYAMLTLLSGILSEYPSVALWGAPERYEGTIVILSYMIMFVYTIAAVNTKEKVKIVLRASLIFGSVIMLIGALQFFGVNIMEIDFFRNILNMQPKWSPYEIHFIFQPYEVYSTLYNPNNYAQFIILLLPVTLAYYSMKKSYPQRGKIAVLVFLCVLTLIGTASSGGYYAVIISLVFLLVMAFPYIKRNILNVTLLMLCVAALLFISNLLTDNRVAEKMNFVSIDSEVSTFNQREKQIFIDDILIGDNDVFIDSTDKDFTVSFADNAVTVLDSSGKELSTEFSPSEKLYTFSDSSYKDYSVSVIRDNNIFLVKIANRNMNFHVTPYGIKVPGMGNKLYDLVPVERNELLYKYPYLFSGRGYIWSGLLPVLKDTVILGHGADTTFLTYPQYDYIGKINMMGKFNIVIEKPHSYYLQAAHDSGWISLVLMIALFAYYLIWTLVILIRRKPRGFNRTMAIAFFCSIIGFLAAYIMYDSSVMTAPVFWTFLAMGISINTLIKNRGDNPPVSNSM